MDDPSRPSQDADDDEDTDLKKSMPRDPRLDEWPEETYNKRPLISSLLNPIQFLFTKWSIWSFAYMNVVLAKGLVQSDDPDSQLTSDDLFVVPTDMQSNSLVELFEKYYHKAAASPTETPAPESNKMQPLVPSKDHEKLALSRLLSVLWNVAAPIYIPAGLCELMVVTCGTCMPLIVMALLKVLEDHPGENVVDQALPLAFCLFLVAILNGFGNHRHRHLAMKTGVAVRAAVVNVLYDRVLHLSPQGKKGLTAGEITNLVAVDTQKLYEVAQDGHLIWALPVNVLSVSFFLYRTLGPATIVGIAVLIGFVPIIQLVTSKMLAIRQKRVKYTDLRVEIVSNMLQGIKVTKLNNYESNYLTRLTETRNQELHHLSLEMAVWATTMFITVVSPVVATGATFATYVMLDENNVLTASDSFGVLLLITALRFPINFAGRLIGKAAQALSAVRRIALFLERPVREEDTGYETIQDATSSAPQDTIDDRHPLTLSKASFRIGDIPVAEGLDSKGSTGFTVEEFDFSLAKGEVLAVCGPVGSGKSTLINGLLGEAESLGDGKVTINGKISYVPQTPFILNRTVRDNILFGLPYDHERYEAVLDACALRADLEQIGDAGDLTEIGERGVTMSGGQKQRVSLARAAYAKSSLYILDDPFSALDAGTGKAVFERLISSSDALLKDSAVLLVTHASHFISNRAVDKIMVLVDGQNRFFGTWEDLATFHPTDENTLRAVDYIKASAREDAEESDDESDGAQEKEEDKTTHKRRGGLIRAEQREHGVSSLKTWLLWFTRAGGLTFFSLQVLFMGIDRLVYVGVEIFLAQWTGAVDEPTKIFGIEFPAQNEGRSAQAEYLRIYAGLILISLVATLIRSEWVVTGGSRATETVFSNMLKSVLKAPISYFETVPMGRILNRFTYDTDVNDVTLTQVISMFLISCSWFVASIIIQCTILPWAACAIFPVAGVYWYLMLQYRKTGPDLQRLDALSRSPLQSMVNECLEGSTSIRVFHQSVNFVERFRGVADVNSSALLNFVTAQRWLGARMELLGSLIVFTSAALVAILNEELGIEPGLVGLLIVWSSNFTIIMNFLVDTFSETEAAITAIERVDAMADLPTEKPMETDPEHMPPANWPTQGSLKFESVCLRYREGLPLALNGLSFEVPAGKTCGVVGRTGAGKSSISVALFRLVEIESGRIFLDGVDLGTLGLSDVRGRGMSIIPQDPFLAGANLRECLDPFGQHSDAEIVEALGAVRMGASGSVDDASLLATPLDEGGSNYSVGERQLINLARAFLTQPKLLVLDEATASIDGETDAFIQKMLRTRFPETTLLTVAHRLNTIMDYDCILVMDVGKAVEFGSPAELLEIPNGVFSELVDATGAESSQALRAMAKGVGKPE